MCARALIGKLSDFRPSSGLLSDNFHLRNASRKATEFAVVKFNNLFLLPLIGRKVLRPPLAIDETNDGSQIADRTEIIFVF